MFMMMMMMKYWPLCGIETSPLTLYRSACDLGVCVCVCGCFRLSL